MATHVLAHPLAAERLTRIRMSETLRPEFRACLTELSRYVIYESMRDLETTPLDINTPLEPTSGVSIRNPPLLVPVMRAGLGMLDAALELLEHAKVGFIGLKRNEETLLPDSYVNTVPDDLAGKDCLVLDPMLATGGSLIHTCDLLRNANAGEIKVACILAAPEGIESFTAAHPGVDIWTASIDAQLNDVGFIQPGLGDAGDRQFGLA